MPKQLKVAIAAAVLLVLFMSSQGTAALWHAKGSMGVGSISTGSLYLLAGNASKAQQDYAFTELNRTNLIPGQFVQAPLVISNGGTTDLAYDLAGASTFPTSATAADKALSTHSVLTIKAGMSAPSCAARNALTDPLYKGPANAAATLGKVRNLSAGEDSSSSETLCIRIEIPSHTPQAAAGGKLNLVLNFVGQQQ
ncbi:hypothetical protein CQ018_06085 [Arthrobacter sp. MYb227]|uniref:hypothetical protein n=1 Tax=Arthrobacter sp. MYb227 TaxID=1848601 RepID=UPI000CFB5DC2|nr:hypothetical protein [Arthrobacter sp. MYb227]PQZ94907.1 hypothetical protein CQ018_06085 [Arthrobacter sp. MYb227]